MEGNDWRRGRNARDRGTEDERMQDEIIRRSVERSEKAKETARQLYRMAMQGNTDEGQEDHSRSEDSRSEEGRWRNSRPKWWCNRHDSNHSSSPFGTATTDDYRNDRALPNKDTALDKTQKMTPQESHVGLPPARFPHFYTNARFYVLHSPYSPLHLESTPRLQNINWRAAYEQLVLADHGKDLNEFVRQRARDGAHLDVSPITWFGRMFGSLPASVPPALFYLDAGSFSIRDPVFAIWESNEPTWEEKIAGWPSRKAIGEAQSGIRGAAPKESIATRIKNEARARRTIHESPKTETDMYEQFLNYNDRNNTDGPSSPAWSANRNNRKSHATPYSPSPPMSPSPSNNAAAFLDEDNSFSNEQKQQGTVTSVIKTVQAVSQPDGSTTVKTTTTHRFADGTEDVSNSEHLEQSPASTNMDHANDNNNNKKSNGFDGEINSTANSITREIERVLGLIDDGYSPHSPSSSLSRSQPQFHSQPQAYTRPRPQPQSQSYSQSHSQPPESVAVTSKSNFGDLWDATFASGIRQDSINHPSDNRWRHHGRVVQEIDERGKEREKKREKEKNDSASRKKSSSWFWAR